MNFKSIAKDFAIAAVGGLTGLTFLDEAVWYAIWVCLYFVAYFSVSLLYQAKIIHGRSIGSRLNLLFFSIMTLGVIVIFALFGQTASDSIWALPSWSKYTVIGICSFLALMSLSAKAFRKTATKF